VRIRLLQSVAIESNVLQLLLHCKKCHFFPIPHRGQIFPILPAASVCDNVTQEQIVANVSAWFDILSREGAPLQEIGIDVRPWGKTTLFLRSGRGEVLLTPIDLYVPTTDAVFPEDVRDALNVLVGRIARLTAENRRS